MALTIRMRIDENDEHSYYYATGSGEEIELIPLVVDANGVFTPAEGKAYNRVTVNVPETELETLIVDANGTYNAPDGKAYDVVTVNVQQIINLQDKSATYSVNGNYTIEADSGYDGLGTVSVAVDVPEPVMPEIEPSKQETIEENGVFTIIPSVGYDAMEEVTVEVDVPTGGSGGDVAHGTFNVVDASEHSIPITVPSGKSVAGFAVVSRIKTGTTDSAFTYIMNGGGRNQTLGFCAVKEVGTNYWFKFLGYKASTASTTSITANMYHQIMNSSAGTNLLNSTVVWDEANDALKYVGREYNSTVANSYGLAIGCTYDYYVWFI